MLLPLCVLAYVRCIWACQKPSPVSPAEQTALYEGIKFPIEIFSAITGNLERPRDMCTLSLVSRYLRQLAQSRLLVLYGRINIPTGMIEPDYSKIYSYPGDGMQYLKDVILEPLETLKSEHDIHFDIFSILSSRDAFNQWAAPLITLLPYYLEQRQMVCPECLIQNLIKIGNYDDVINSLLKKINEAFDDGEKMAWLALKHKAGACLIRELILLSPVEARDSLQIALFFVEQNCSRFAISEKILSLEQVSVRLLLFFIDIGEADLVFEILNDGPKLSLNLEEDKIWLDLFDAGVNGKSIVKLISIQHSNLSNKQKGFILCVLDTSETGDELIGLVNSSLDFLSISIKALFSDRLFGKYSRKALDKAEYGPLEKIADNINIANLQDSRCLFKFIRGISSLTDLSDVALKKIIRSYEKMLEGLSFHLLSGDHFKIAELIGTCPCLSFASKLELLKPHKFYFTQQPEYIFQRMLCKWENKLGAERDNIESGINALLALVFCKKSLTNALKVLPLVAHIPGCLDQLQQWVDSSLSCPKLIVANLYGWMLENLTKQRKTPNQLALYRIIAERAAPEKLASCEELDELWLTLKDKAGIYSFFEACMIPDKFEKLMKERASQMPDGAFIVCYNFGIDPVKMSTVIDALFDNVKALDYVLNFLADSLYANTFLPHIVGHPRFGGILGHLVILRLQTGCALKTIIDIVQFQRPDRAQGELALSYMIDNRIPEAIIQAWLVLLPECCNINFELIIKAFLNRWYSDELISKLACQCTDGERFVLSRLLAQITGFSRNF